MFDVHNATGSSIGRNPSDRGLTQSSQDITDPAEIARNDSRFANEAQQKSDDGDIRGALDAAENIRDSELRVRVFKLIREKAGAAEQFITAGAAFSDGVVGIADPHILFFMVVFYLNQRSPRINWNDILKSVSSITNTDFQSIGGQGGEPFPIPQTRAIASLEAAQVARINEEAARQNGNRGTEATLAKIRKEVNEKQAELRRQIKEDIDKVRKNAEQQGKKAVQNLNSGSAAASVLWPFQNMPTIESGWTKSVEWGSAKQAVTFAEPILTNDGGASSIELDVKFTYAVGLPGLGSDILPWSTEHLLGVIYLASSLVYPFTAHGLISSRGANETDRAKQPPSDDDKAQAQFPVLLMRHHSLFPFLTPFVVKSVTIQPDENQPLLITEPIRLNEVDTHLTLPAVRQIVNITLSLTSAHYYLPAFGADPDDNLRLQTSGSTYLSLAARLLGEKFRG